MNLVRVASLLSIQPKGVSKDWFCQEWSDNSTKNLAQPTWIKIALKSNVEEPQEYISLPDPWGKLYRYVDFCFI
jgi:hypothetical protein